MKNEEFRSSSISSISSVGCPLGESIRCRAATGFNGESGICNLFAVAPQRALMANPQSIRCRAAIYSLSRRNDSLQ